MEIRVPLEDRWQVLFCRMVFTEINDIFRDTCFPGTLNCLEPFLKAVFFIRNCHVRSSIN